MVNLTLAIADETKKKMDSHPSVRWSNAVRATIEKKLEEFEEAERLAKKGRLKIEDFESLSKEIGSAAGKHAKRLLHESNS